MPATHIEGAIYYKMANAAAITALVPAARIYHIKQPESVVFPSIVYQKSSSVSDYTLTQTVDLSEITMMIHSYADSDLAAKGVAKAVFNTLNGLREVVDGFNIQRVIRETELDLFEDETSVFHVMQLYRILYLEK